MGLPALFLGDQRYPWLPFLWSCSLAPSGLNRADQRVRGRREVHLIEETARLSRRFELKSRPFGVSTEVEREARALREQ